METNEINAVYASYGIDPASLSPEVREGLNAILRNLGRTALEQFQVILEAEARKRGISIGTPKSTAEQEAAVQKAAEEFKAQQEAEAAEAKRKKVYTYVGVGVGALLVIVGVVFFIRKRRK